MLKNRFLHIPFSLVFAFTAEAGAMEAKHSISTAYFAGGCFWGVEYFFEKQTGVIEVIPGYMGGKKEYPTYREVNYRHSNYVQLVEVRYDAGKVDYETLARLFFEIHDPSQTGGQGPDTGDQYSSVIFYGNDAEKDTAEKLIQLLQAKGLEIATQLKAVMPFWRAEDRHQDYYSKNGGTPYCHGYIKRF